MFLTTTGCTIEREPHLYPINETASPTGVLEAKMLGHGQLHGTLEITTPGGELLRGEYSIVSSFGNIFATAYGGGG